MKVSVRVPATSANLGPGFDCMGLALPIYNTITIEETVLPGSGIEINIITDNAAAENSILEEIPRDENNLAYKAIEVLYNSIGQEPSELKINIQSDIPITRGLGSSASVIVGALVAANKLHGFPADETALISIATEVEGHPDNVTPAIVGGLVFSSLEEDGSILYRKLNWPTDWELTFCIPDFELSTAISRSVIPKEIPLADAVYNLKHSAMLVHAIETVDDELLKRALHDKIHQPYRMKLIPGMSEIVEKLNSEQGILGCVLSGAGPTLLVISKNYNTDKIKSDVKEIWNSLGISSDIRTLKIEQQGAVILD